MQTALKLAAVVAKNSMGSCPNSKLVCRDSMLSIATTDGYHATLYSRLPMTGEFEAVVDTKQLAKTMGQFKTADMSCAGSKLKISNEKRSVSLSLVPGQFYTHAVPTTQDVEFNREELLKVVAFCAVAMSRDKHRLPLHMLQLEVENGTIRFTATDEERLHSSVVYPTGSGATLPTATFSLQTAAVTTLLAVLKAVKVPTVTLHIDCANYNNAFHLVVRAGAHILMLTEDARWVFPAYRSVISPLSSATYAALIDSQELAAALTLGKTAAETTDVVLALGTDGVVSCGYGDKEVSATIEVTRELGEDCRIPMNGQFLKDALLGLDGDAVFVNYMQDNCDPVRLADPNNPDYWVVIGQRRA